MIIILLIAVVLMAMRADLKILTGAKDGGPESRVYVWGLEIKGLFSVLVLRFDEGSREAFHSHAFNSVSWVLSGALHETRDLLPSTSYGWLNFFVYEPSLRPVITKRSTFHKVAGIGPSSWVLTFRGPWAATWRDVSAAGDVTLTHGRKVVG